MNNNQEITMDTPLPVVHTPEETRKMVSNSLNRSRNLLLAMDPWHKQQMLELMIFMLEAEFGLAPEGSKRIVDLFSRLDHALTGFGARSCDGVPNEADVAFENLVEKSAMKMGQHMLKRMSYFLLEAEKLTDVSAEMPSES